MFIFFGSRLLDRSVIVPPQAMGDAAQCCMIITKKSVPCPVVWLATRPIEMGKNIPT